jgi:hypothetical protein
MVVIVVVDQGRHGGHPWSNAECEICERPHLCCQSWVSSSLTQSVWRGQADGHAAVIVFKDGSRSLGRGLGAGQVNWVSGSDKLKR